MEREELVTNYIKIKLMQLLGSREIKTNYKLLEEADEGVMDNFITAQQLLCKARYLSLEINEKVHYLKDLKSDEFLTTQEYIDFLFMYLELDTDDKVKQYIYKTFFEDSMFFFEKKDIEYIKNILKGEIKK